ncbi:helix-turn-helix domain-containing protein [Mesorhizobium sp.]|uniref:helix-turn-helix domain-containing protein n=1 Tax=Mesorhizobium sp. TaxID=1871066 RepID=UPI0025FCAC3C|nr:helix-turn-helix transcriptional regulator [Mesorhizobium sp.]
MPLGIERGREAACPTLPLQIWFSGETAYPIWLHTVEPSIFGRSQLARDMAGPSFDDWIDQLGLREVRDPHFDKPVYRKAPFGNFTLSADIEKEISASLRRVRDKRKIPRSKFAPMLGLSEPVYVRYERAVSKLTVGRLLHICELLDVSPLEILFPAAPHLWGDDQAEAEQRKAIIESSRTSTSWP